MAAMNQREQFVQLISYGPSKLPISYILEAFDLATKGQASEVPHEVVQEVDEQIEKGEHVSAAAVEAWQQTKEAILAQRAKHAGPPKVVKDDWKEEEPE